MMTLKRRRFFVALEVHMFYIIKTFWPSYEAFLTSHYSSMKTIFLDFVFAKNVHFPIFCACAPEENEKLHVHLKL